METLLNTSDVAQILGVPPRTVQSWRHARRGPVFLRVGTGVRYRRTDVEAWIEERLDETRLWMAS